MAHFLLYWRPETVEFHLSHNFLLRNVGSRQIQRASGGDTIWIITSTEGFELGLAGRLWVGEIVSRSIAEIRLQTTDLWASEYHALAAQGTSEYMRGIGMGFNAAALRFADGQPDRFMVVDGQISPDQLKRMREVTADSINILQNLWLAANLIHP
jgi:hypothetical protein